MLLHRLEKDKLIHPPKWLADNTHYVTVMGSVAYGVSGDMSDMDCYGFAFPPKEIVFPHLAGHIPGFGEKPQGFDVWQEHHVKQGDKEYDFSIYSVVKYFDLLMENNPNMVDSLFTPDRCIKHVTNIGQMVRDRRKLFLHKGSFHKFRGYAYAQLKKVENARQDNDAYRAVMAFEDEHGIPHSVSWADVQKEKEDRDRGTGFFNTKFVDLDAAAFGDYYGMFERMILSSKRLDSIKRFGFDVKFAYHIVRLALECEQILTEGDLDLERNSEVLKAIRRGEWTLERMQTWFADKEVHLENAKDQSKLPHGPDVDAIRGLLLECLEHHYGSLDKAVVRQTDADALRREIQAVLDRYS